MIHTIWKYAMCFGTSQEHCERQLGDKEYPEDVLYEGAVDKIPRDLAEEICEIHPNAFKYYKEHLMALYKGYGSLKTGTENPIGAIGSRRTAREIGEEHNHVVIWNAIER